MPQRARRTKSGKPKGEQPSQDYDYPCPDADRVCGAAAYPCQGSNIVASLTAESDDGRMQYVSQAYRVCGRLPVVLEAGDRVVDCLQSEQTHRWVIGVVRGAGASAIKSLRELDAFYESPYPEEVGLRPADPPEDLFAFPDGRPVIFNLPSE